jgi:hypothetical protein
MCLTLLERSVTRASLSNKRVTKRVRCGELSRVLLHHLIRHPVFQGTKPVEATPRNTPWAWTLAAVHALTIPKVLRRLDWIIGRINLLMVATTR